MQTAIQSGDIKSIQDLLAQRFPTLKFETLEEEPEEVAKPEEPTATAPTAPVTEAPKEETTASLFEDYMANLPAVTRPLVTTDYKGVRGGRLGEGNYTTASIIPGAQVSTPTPAPAPASAPSTGGGVTTTYNAPVIGGDWQQYYGDYLTGDVNYGTIGYGAETAKDGAAPAASAYTTKPAWSMTPQNIGTTTSKAGAGLVPSTQSRGTYVSPSSPAASSTAQAHVQTATQAVQSGSGLGIRQVAAAGGDSNKLGATGVAAILAAPGSNKQAAEQALRQAEKGNITLTPNARQALQQAAKKK
jgi:hypothetical protein